MRLRQLPALFIASLAGLALVGCAAMPSIPQTAPNEPDTGVSDETGTTDVDTDESSDESAGGTEITIPDGARAASAEFPFPVPEGWAELGPFAESKLGKDMTMSGSYEYPGDAKVAAAEYMALLTAAGFNAYTYAPGELTNKASIAAEGIINGKPYFALLNFDVHADGYQRVSIIAIEED
jgi:hypothetical protein